MSKSIYASFISSGDTCHVSGKPKMFDVTKSCKIMNVMFRSYEVKEALRVQMEVQSKLHLQVEVCFFFLEKWNSCVS